MFVALANERSVNIRLQESLSSIQRVADRTLVRDATLGNPFPELTGYDLVSLKPGAQAGNLGIFIWIVEIEECIDCFGAISEWNEIANSSPIEISTILVSRSVNRAKQLASRVGLRGEVLVDTADIVREAMNFDSPSVHLLADQQRIIRFVDARNSLSDCYVSPSAALTSLLHLGKSENLAISEAGGSR